MRALLLAVLLLGAATADADWQPVPTDELQVQTAAALDALRAEHGDVLAPYFDEAHAFAVFPKIRGGGAVFGWNWGKGLVIAGDRLIGHVRQRRVSLGAQLGYQAEAQIIFFRDAATLAEFKAGQLEFTPQASANIGKAGGAENTGFDTSVAVFSATRSGLMLEMAAGATKYRYRAVE